MVVKNFESVGMGLMENRHRVVLAGPPNRPLDGSQSAWTHIRDVQAQKRGVLLVGIHFLTLGAGCAAVWYAGSRDRITARTIIH
ncbi:hypothetical protein ACLK1S_06545 [Escherichia coli]